MTLLDYIKIQKIKLKTLSECSDIPYTTVGDIVNGRTDIDNVSVKYLIRLAAALNISTDELYRLAKKSTVTPALENGYSLSIKSVKYFITKGGKSYFLCKNVPVCAKYIMDISQTFIKNHELEERVNTWQTLL